VSRRDELNPWSNDPHDPAVYAKLQPPLSDEADSVVHDLDP